MRRLVALLLAVLVIGACIPPIATPSGSPSPTTSAAISGNPSAAPSGAADLDMSAILLAKPIPYADGFALTRTVRGRDGSPAKGFEPVRTSPPVEDVGTQQEFWTYDFAAMKNVKTTATIRLITEHVKWWIANGVNVDAARLRTTANSFEQKIYPTDRSLYGEEWSPGIDADPRINVIIARLPGGAAGYFSGSDEEPRWVNEFSAEREVLYINSAMVGSADLDRVIAHEFCHMIQFNTRRRSAVWFNEGHAVLCEKMNGFAPTDGDAYLRLPDTQLNDWADLSVARPHYGEAFLFLDYLRQQAGGDDLIRAFMQKGIDTPADFDAVLKQRGQPGVEEMFANFVAANMFIGTSGADRPFTYPQGVSARSAPNVLPADVVTKGQPLTSTVREYSVRYLELPKGPLRVKFDGATTNRLIQTDPHSGQHMWWSDKGDGMDATLTKTIDLGSLPNPVLSFWTWYEIEVDYDYAYVEVSTDGGAQWTPLATESSSTTDPNGENLGNGITGGSGGATATGWRHLTASLAPYAGKQIQLRFQYVTDGNLNLGGFAIDDIDISGQPLDDAESDNGWTSSGFVRSTNLVSQRYTVQVLRFGDRPTVERHAVDNGQLTLDLDTSGDRRAPVLAVTGFAVRTTQPVSFSVSAENRP